MVGEVLHVEDRQQLQRTLVRLALAPPIRRRAQDARERGVRLGVVQTDLYVLLHRHGVEQADILKRTGDAHAVDLVDRLAARVVTVEQNRPARGRIHFGEQVEHRGLACAVGSDKASDLGLADGEVEVVDRLQTAEVDTEMQGLQDGGGVDVALGHDGMARHRHHLATFKLEFRHRRPPPSHAM